MLDSDFHHTFNYVMKMANTVQMQDRAQKRRWLCDVPKFVLRMQWAHLLK